MEPKEQKFESWKEYPERDREYVRYYPPTVGPLEPGNVWEKKEMGLYVHIPFCKSVCKYCPFNTYPWNQGNVERYLKALKKEITMVGNMSYMQDSTIAAVNFGGGTPTSLTTEQLLDILNCCKDHFNIHPAAEVTVEANPDTVNENKLNALLAWGVNRMSFGVQSFNNKYLEMVGRAHRAEQSITSLKLARSLGLKNLGIDLLYRIPGQTIADWEKELDMAIALKIDHISIFSLLLNPGTQLFQDHTAGKIPPQPNEDLEIAMYERAREKLTRAGYRHYIIYDFVLPGKECDYHSISWQVPQREYPGLGAGAMAYVHGYIYTNINALEEYIQTVNNGRLPISFGRQLTREDQISRAMTLGTKFLQVDKNKFKKQFGVEMETLYGDIIQQLEEYGLLENHPDAVTVTPKGMTYISNVNKAFYTPEHYRMPQPIGIQLQKKEGLFLSCLRRPETPFIKGVSGLP